MIWVPVPTLYAIGVTENFHLMPLPAVVKYSAHSPPVTVSGAGYCRVAILQSAVSLATAQHEALLEGATGPSKAHAELEHYTFRFYPYVDLLGLGGEIWVSPKYSRMCDTPQILAVRTGFVRTLGGTELFKLCGTHPRYTTEFWNDEAIRSFLKGHSTANAPLAAGGRPGECPDPGPTRSRASMFRELLLDRVDQLLRVPIADVGSVEGALGTTFDSRGRADPIEAGFSLIEYARDDQHVSVRMYPKPDVCVTTHDLALRVGSPVYPSFFDRPDDQSPFGEGAWVAAAEPRLRALMDMQTACLVWIALVEDI